MVVRPQMTETDSERTYTASHDEPAVDRVDTLPDGTTVPRISPRPAGSIVERARSEALPIWVLLPLRAFMGFTFVFAGLQKISNRQFFTAGAPGSIQEQLQASHLTSPVKFLVTPALHAPVAFGVVIALAELAVGIGVLLGLLGRIAAAGGMVLSLLFFLTVSFNTWPYYYGSDIVFFFAWTPLLLAGSGPLSVDALVKARVRSELEVRSVAPMEGELRRRTALRQLGFAGLAGAAGLFIAGFVATIGRAASGTSNATGSTATTPTSSGSRTGGTEPVRTTTKVATPKGTRIGTASAVPVGGAASFTNPSNQEPAYVVQPRSGAFVAHSAICTHAGCTVGFQRGDPPEFVCPCHGSVFNAETGEVIQGPAVLPLPSIAIEESTDGQLYAS